MIPSNSVSIAESLFVHPFLLAYMVRPSVAYATSLMASIQNIISIGFI